MKTKINIYCYELTHKTNPALKYNFYTLASNIDNRFNNCSAYGFMVNNAQGYSERLTFDDIINMRYLSCALYENYLYLDSKDGGQSWTLFREMGSVELKPEYCLSGEITLYAYTNKISKGNVLRDCLWYSPNTDDIEVMKSNVRSGERITWFGARLADDDNTDWANNWWYGGVELNDERIANDLMDFRKVKATYACATTRIDTLQRVPEKDITISNISDEPDWVPTPLAHNSIFEVSKAIAHQIGIEKEGSNKYEVAYNILEKLYGDVNKKPAFYCYEVIAKSRPDLVYYMYSPASNIDNRFNKYSLSFMLARGSQGQGVRLTLDDIYNSNFANVLIDGDNGVDIYAGMKLGSISWEYLLTIGSIEHKPEYDLYAPTKFYAYRANISDAKPNGIFYTTNTGDEAEMQNLVKNQQLITRLTARLGDDYDTDPAHTASGGATVDEEAIANGKFYIYCIKANSFISYTRYMYVTRVPELDFTLGDTQIDPSKLAYSFDNLYGVTLNILDLIKNNEIHPEPKPNKLTFDGSTWTFERTPDIDTYVLGDLYVNGNKVGTYQGFTTKNSISDWEEAALDIISDSFGNQALTIIKENEEWRTK